MSGLPSKHELDEALVREREARDALARAVELRRTIVIIVSEALKVAINIAPVSVAGPVGALAGATVRQALTLVTEEIRKDPGAYGL